MCLFVKNTKSSKINISFFQKKKGRRSGMGLSPISSVKAKNWRFVSIFELQPFLGSHFLSNYHKNSNISVVQRTGERDGNML
jgi:hypothetical protein